MFEHSRFKYRPHYRLMDPKFPFFKWRKALPGLRELPQATVVCGDRHITLRGATGEVGPDGPFPYIEFSDGEGFPVHAEYVFDELWNNLKDLKDR